MFKNAKSIYQHLTTKASGAGACASGGAPEDSQHLDKFVSWFEEHVDAEEVENNLLRITNVVSLWCKEVSSHRYIFGTPEEMQVWEKFFYAGLEACVPIDQESTLKDSAQYSCPPLPNLFGGKMYLEHIEQKMGLLGTIIDGVESSVKSPPPAAKPNPKSKNSLAQKR